MKSEKEIKTQLKIAKKELREVRKRFEKYDNHDDMDLIPVVEQEIKTLGWILGESNT